MTKIMAFFVLRLKKKPRKYFFHHLPTAFQPKERKHHSVIIAYSLWVIRSIILKTLVSITCHGYVLWENSRPMSHWEGTYLPKMLETTR